MSSAKDYADRMNRADSFETRVHHLEDADLFYTVDKTAKAEEGDWVAVESGESFTLELFNGQPHACVANLLEFYSLSHSNQWRPKIKGLAESA